MRIAAVVLALGGASLAAPDAVRIWRHEVSRVDQAERRFWSAFTGRFQDAYEDFIQPFKDADAKSAQFTDVVYDYSMIRRLYEEFVGLQRQRGEAAAALAASGHPQSAAALRKALWVTLKEIEKAEKALAEARPQQDRYIFDLRPGVLRHGLAERERALIDALARVPGVAADLAADGLREAARRDRGRSIRHRVAVLDALGLSGDPAARPALEATLRSPLSSLRIAAVEALARFGPDSLPALVPLLDDPRAPVRRALLQMLRERVGSPRAVGPLVDRLPAARGLQRREMVQTLEALTGQRFGWAPRTWREWYGEYRPDIENGRFDRGKVEIQEVERVPVRDAISFYGIGTPSKRVVFLIEGSWILSAPASVELLKTRYVRLWIGAPAAWLDGKPTLKQVLQRQLRRTLLNLPSDASYAVSLLHADFRTESLGGRRMLRYSERDRKEVLERIERQRTAVGWCSQYAGLLEAMRLCGMDPSRDDDFPKARADTVYLWDTGSPAGGRFMLPEAVLDAFSRLNRYRRLVVHTIRVANAKEEGERLMKGLAERSGGSYRWQAEPPSS
ncbi:MAG: HEAT repeat domain-containing protein [Planctomycetota bacterium]